MAERAREEQEGRRGILTVKVAVMPGTAVAVVAADTAGGLPVTASGTLSVATGPQICLADHWHACTHKRKRSSRAGNIFRRATGGRRLNSKSASPYRPAATKYNKYDDPDRAGFVRWSEPT